MASEEVSTSREEDLNQCTEEELEDVSSSQENGEDFVPCSTDAGHPRMSMALRRKEAQNHSFYCDECDVYFLPSELDEHFNKHKAFKLCQYCRKEVFKYFIKKTNELKIYHTCSYSETVESSSHPTTDVNMNL